MRLGEMLFDGISRGKSCAYTVVVYIVVLIAEELAYAFTRKSSTTVLFASQGARASSAPAKAAVERWARRRTRWIGQGGEAGDGDWEALCDGRREEIEECGWG